MPTKVTGTKKVIAAVRAGAKVLGPYPLAPEAPPGKEGAPAYWLGRPAGLAPVGEKLHAAIDEELARAYSNGADTVWRSLGVGQGLPNEAVWDERVGTYVVRLKRP